MKLFYFYGFVLLLNLITGCSGQERTNIQQPALSENKKLVGGGCDGCELMYVGIPVNIDSKDTSSGWNEKSQQLILTGTVFQLDGRTPAPNVIIYYWHTDKNGLYSLNNNTPEKAKKHGHLRGWVKTDNNGKYSIYTIRPAPYPNEDLPAHIHISIKEPNIKNEYYIDDFVFDDDKLLIPAVKKKPLENRGGSGILRVLISNDVQIAEHNIILGLNIPDYPQKLPTEKQSGLSIGEDNPSFIPFHAYGNENNYSKPARQNELEKIGIELNLKNIALTFVPSLEDLESEVNLNKINPVVENTFIIYRHRTIIEKFIDLKPTLDNFKIISATLDKSKSQYFNLPEPKHD